MKADAELLREAMALMDSVGQDTARELISRGHNNGHLHALALAAWKGTLIGGTEGANMLRSAIDIAFCLGFKEAQRRTKS